MCNHRFESTHPLMCTPYALMPKCVAAARSTCVYGAQPPVKPDAQHIRYWPLRESPCTQTPGPERTTLATPAQSMIQHSHQHGGLIVESFRDRVELIAPAGDDALSTQLLQHTWVKTTSGVEWMKVSRALRADRHQAVQAGYYKRGCCLQLRPLFSQNLCCAQRLRGSPGTHAMLLHHQRS